MALTIKNIYVGTLTTTTSTVLFTVAANTSVLIKNISLVNKDASARTVRLQAQIALPSTTTCYIAPLDISIPPSAQVVLDSEFTLSGDATHFDSILGWASAGSAIDCVINGLVRNN